MALSMGALRIQSVVALAESDGDKSPWKEQKDKVTDRFSRISL